MSNRQDYFEESLRQAMIELIELDLIKLDNELLTKLFIDFNGLERYNELKKEVKNEL